MKKKTRMPVTIPLDYDGSYSDVIQDFINLMNEATRKNTLVDISLKGYVTIKFESEVEPKVEIRPELNLDALYRGDYMKNIMK